MKITDKEIDDAVFELLKKENAALRVKVERARTALTLVTSGTYFLTDDHWKSIRQALKELGEP